MSLSTIRVIFLLLLVAIIGQIVKAQDEPDELTEKMTLWSQFFNRITSVGLENLREHLPGLVPPAEVKENLTSEATTTPYDRFIIRGGEELPHRAPARKLTGEGASKSQDLNKTIVDDADLVVNTDNTTAVSNATNNFPIDADSNNVNLTKNDASYGDGNENTTKSPFPLEEHIFREEPRRTLFQQTDPNGTPGTVFNLNANANSNSDPNVSNHFDPSNFLSNLTPLVLPLINTFGTSLNEQHLQLLEDQKRRLALLSAPRSYVPNDGEELPGFGTALYNELVQNRRPSGFGSALANDLARSEQTQNVIQAVKVSPPTAYPHRYRPLVRGLPVYPRISAESVSTTVVPLRRNGSPLPRRRYSSVPESIQKAKETQLFGVESSQASASQVESAKQGISSLADIFEGSLGGALGGGSAAPPGTRSNSPAAVNVDQGMQFLGSANDRVSGPNEDNGFGSAFPDYSNLPGGSVTKENSFGLPSFGQQPRNYDRHELGSSDREYGSFNLPQLMAAAAQNRQDTTGQGSSATTSFPSLNNEEHPFLPDTFSLQADSGRDDQAPDFVAGSGIVAADSSTRGPPAGVFGSGRQPDESFFDSL